MLTKGLLHYTIIKHIIDEGYAPDLKTLSLLLNIDPSKIKRALYELQDYHGVVLHPDKPAVWVIHPFSMAPTNFFVKSARGSWWGNCAWCSLGVAALLKEDLTITTRLGAYDEQIVIHISDGKLIEKNFLVHFPVPMANAWNNVIYTCSTMLVFRNEEQIIEWSKQHNIPMGDIQPLDNVWAFSKKWYGNHLNPDWEKWTMQEAREIFKEFNLTDKIWDLEKSEERF
jgi:hypothetical protein